MIPFVTKHRYLCDMQKRHECWSLTSVQVFDFGLTYSLRLEVKLILGQHLLLIGIDQSSTFKTTINEFN
jgi:hypothetical protein